MTVNGYIDWPDVAPKSEDTKTEGRIEYLWLKGGEKYNIRPFHKAVHFFKFFHRNAEGELRTALCADPDTCSVLEDHPDLAKPASRYAIYVIDRADGKLKVMEGPKTVFVPFRQRWEATNKDPGGSITGGDWQIEVTGKGKKTKYALTYIEDTPLTAEEKQMIKEIFSTDQEKLKNLYKSHTDEEIKERLFSASTKEDSGSSEFLNESTNLEGNEDLKTDSVEKEKADEDFDMTW